MKKSDLILIGALVIIVLVALFSTKGTYSMDIEFPVTLHGEAGMHKISYSEYEDLVKTNEPFIIIIERTGCGYCQMYMPIVEEVVNEKHISIYYIDTDDLSSEEMQKLESENKYFKKNPKWGTPTTLFMQGDYIIDSIGGYVEKDSFLSFIEDRVVYGE